MATTTRTTHEVQVWNHHGSRRTRWYACDVVGRRSPPPMWLKVGLTTEWFDCRLRDGTVYQDCNPECVRAKTQG